MSIHFSADQDTVDTIYRIILSVNQLSVYGAVAAICDEYEKPPRWNGATCDIGGTVNCSWRSQSRSSSKSFCSNIFNKLNRFHQKTD